MLLEAADGLTVEVVEGAGETVTITGWAEWAPAAGDLPVDDDPATGLWATGVAVPERRWASLDAGKA